ncbi:MAG TPA: cellulose synthase complex periplasmic endoglucanase BcsZ [Terracidiphilus sp.]
MSPKESRSRRLLLVPILFLLGVTGGCKQGPWSLWNSYASRFIDGQGRVVDPMGGGRTTSEGQSYAMFFALADNDPVRFDQLLKWTQTNMANGNMAAHLPGWLWGKSKDGQWKTLDPNPASDSDAWIAYSLIEAGRLWNNHTYTLLGRQMMSLIAKQEVAELPGFGFMLLPGPAAAFQHNGTWTLNPSYVPLFIFERFAVVDPAGPWGAIALNIPRLLRQSARHGFALDWVDYVPSDGFYPASAPGAAASDPKQPTKDIPPPVGSYDAIRVYLWAGMLDETGQTRSELLSAVAGMGSYVADHGAPPEKVSDQGIPMEQDGPVGFSAATLPYLRAFPDREKAAAQQRIRMSAQFDPSSGLYGKDPAYYDQNLVLFATGFLDSRFRFGSRGELKVEWTRS